MGNRHSSIKSPFVDSIQASLRQISFAWRSVGHTTQAAYAQPALIGANIPADANLGRVGMMGWTFNMGELESNSRVSGFTRTVPFTRGLRG